MVDLAEVVKHTADATHLAQSTDAVSMDGSARSLWSDVYESLTSSAASGLLSSVASRSAPHILRLALIYCLLDCRDTINREHLEAALAVWRYVEQTAAFIFGDSLGDPDADKLLAAIKAAPRA